MTGNDVAKARVVYMMGLPRTGSTLAKRYLGDFKDFFVLAPFDDDFHSAWRQAQTVQEHQIVVDKRTANLRRVTTIYRAYGHHVCYLAIVRDPRDELASLWQTTRHPDIPRRKSFWRYWCNSYGQFLTFARRAAKDGADVGLVRYEDLVRTPEIVKGRFLSWLGIPFSPEEITTQYSPVAAFALEQDLNEDFKAHQTDRVHGDSVGRWRHYLDDVDKARVIVAYRRHAASQALMTTFGYGDALGDQDVDALESSGVTCLTGRT